MKILAIGLNHKTAGVDVRECLAFSGPKLQEGIVQIRTLPRVSEVVLLSTCNRVELYAAVDDIPVAAEQIKNFLAHFHGRPRNDFEQALYTHADVEAVKHLFRVASSLDSMVIGEPQILGQLKEAFDLSLSKKTTGVLLNKLLKKAISTAKRVRTETRIAENAVSVSFAAVELARKIFTELAGTSFMLLGAGDMAELAARHLLNNGVKDVKVANRTYERAVELALEFSGKAVRFEDLLQELVAVDILICSTGAPTYVLLKDQMQKVMKARRHRPVFIIDIAVPRNIDPDINKIDNVYLYSIDDLQDVVDTNRVERQKEAARAEEIVNEEVANFMHWLESLTTVPTIVSLRQKAEDVRMEEFQKFKDRFPGLDLQTLKAVDYLTAAIVNKLIHPPTAALKDEKSNREELTAVIKKLYGINGDEK